jgi:hypothetical protein
MYLVMPYCLDLRFVPGRYAWNDPMVVADVELI